MSRLTGRLDTICCYDVLEHMGDPCTVLRRLLGVATIGARLHLSVPNGRHCSLVRDLVLRGPFGYTEWEHRDNTHLRSFTRHYVVQAIEDAGWTVHSTSYPALHRSAALDRLTRGHSTEFLVGQGTCSPPSPRHEPARRRAPRPRG